MKFASVHTRPSLSPEPNCPRLHDCAVLDDDGERLLRIRSRGTVHPESRLW
jgi:hypothetical protein